MKVLLDACGKQMNQSLGGWDPQGLAIFRGHFETAKLLGAVCQVSPEHRKTVNSKEELLSSALSQLTSEVDRNYIVRIMRHDNVTCDGCEQVGLKPQYKQTPLPFSRLTSVFMAHDTNALSVTTSTFASSVFYRRAKHMHMNLRQSCYLDGDRIPFQKMILTRIINKR